eukprot:4989781-Amphidinium_carterae.1
MEQDECSTHVLLELVFWLAMSGRDRLSMCEARWYSQGARLVLVCRGRRLFVLLPARSAEKLPFPMHMPCRLAQQKSKGPRGGGNVLESVATKES